MDEIKTEQTEQKSAHLDSGAYEVIKNRLIKHGNDLKERLDKLNTARKNVFGSIETTLLGSERIITENNCIPRDMAPVGTSFIFGYNVYMGLKSKIDLEDVFSIYEFKDHAFQKLSLSLIEDGQFKTDFNELYTYYKNTFFAKFSVIGPYLYMIFQIGKNASDIKAFKWIIEDGKLRYIDNRSDHEVRFTARQEFGWVRVRREDHRDGLHPHVSILDKVFVETIGGDLTIKVEDNTDTGKGIYSEEVEDKDQTLDDAEMLYAVVGHIILLKIRPYKEKRYRHFIFNEKLKNVVRIDAIEDACVLLPDDHGLIFPKGYYLKSGEYKLFDVPVETCIFEQRIESPNGEDYQYFFYNIESGIYLIYSYNVIEQTLETPIVCNGYSHFKNGEMIVFRQENEPRKNHMIQIWQTPYVGKNHVTETKNDSILFKIGNKDIVRSMADCKVVYNLIQKGESYADIYVDIVKEADQIIDSYFWLSKEEAFDLKSVLVNIREASASAVAEFEKVTRIKTATLKQINDVDEKAQKLLKDIEYGNFNSISEYVGVLANLRILRGEVASLKDLRYTNLPMVESLEAKVKEKNELFSQRCVEFLLHPDGLKPYMERVKEHEQAIAQVSKASIGKELSDGMSKTSSDLELLIDIVSNFKIEDATKTTEIIENISLIYSQLNGAKAKLKTRMDELSQKEGAAQFNSQVKLLDQAVVNYLDISDSIEKCEQYLSKVMVQIEELEGKFADFEEYVLKLSEKREELYNAFETKKQALLEKQNKKLTALAGASDRILKGIVNRLQGFNTIDEINGYFATDIMIEKVRDIVDQLTALGDSVKADELEGRLKTIKEDAVRQLKDKQDLFVGGKNVIKFGNHYFSVNTKQLDLSMVQKDDELYFHISGTDFWEKAESDKLNRFRHVWDQEIPSENREVYRAQYLAYKIFEASQNKEADSVEVLLTYPDEQLLLFIQKFMESRYQEGYTKGVHDVDCHKILKALMNLYKSIDLLIYSSSARALAQLYWCRFAREEMKETLGTRLRELSKISMYFKTKPDLKDYIPAVKASIEEAIPGIPFFDRKFVPEAAEYLCSELMRGDTFVISLEAQEIYLKFISHLKEKKALEFFNESLKAVSKDLEGSFYLIREWLFALFDELGLKNRFDVIDEVIIMIMLNSYNSKQVVETRTKLNVTGLGGNHPNIKNGEFTASYTEFIERLKNYDSTIVRDFIEFQALKKELTQNLREELRLDEFKPGVLSSFVRNKLIDKVYLPLIGDNLAKQIGVAGENKRTDLMGMLLLISPPGYGKTTLMEYIASRLGITMIKINGPALGHEVTSLDPTMAKNASAKEELRKLNLAFKMGNNVMIYVDDIQHCNPEFLQKFIPLCDGQRKIEGVYKGVGQTYDLRGKKVAVVMAGNPYTESGEKFKIPDMLSNRADVYNLGDMLKENKEAFMLSYIENCITSNPVLSKLSNKSQKDIYTFIEIAERGERDGLNFEGNYSIEEINEFVEVIKKLIRIRDIVLKINMEYIHSAAQADEYRKEPPFKLQGSYRNMNKIAERIVPVMNDQELSELVLGVYENDAQTLTTGTEANMLKWKEIAGCLSEKESLRWEEIKVLFNKNKLVKGDDKIGQAVLMLSDFGSSLKDLVDVMTKIKETHSLGVDKFVERLSQVNKKSEK
ncbi:MAG: DNA repair ATPase [Bacillota bacterium]